MESLSFDGLVEEYDRTRTLDPICFNAVLEYLVERYPPAEYCGVFEPGIGTGRIAIPLAQRGYCVTGVDISGEMLAVLDARMKATDGNLAVRWSIGDVCELPFDDGVFDMAIAVHLFYFIRDWRTAADEILRVVKPGGPVVLINTGHGKEIPFINDRYRQLSAELGCEITSIGAHGTADVLDFYADRGCGVEVVRDRWMWTLRTRLDEALGHIRARAYSFTTIASEQVHQAAVDRLEHELVEHYGDLEQTIEVPAQIYLAIVRR